jgi:hypothetical protein
MLDLDPFDALALSLHHSPGVYAILVGSGLSHAAGIPTGWEITLNLVSRLATLDGGKRGRRGTLRNARKIGPPVVLEEGRQRDGRGVGI